MLDFFYREFRKLARRVKTPILDRLLFRRDLEAALGGSPIIVDLFGSSILEDENKVYNYRVPSFRSIGSAIIQGLVECKSHAFELRDREKPSHFYQLERAHAPTLSQRTKRPRSKRGVKPEEIFDFRLTQRVNDELQGGSVKNRRRKEN